MVHQLLTRAVPRGRRGGLAPPDAAGFTLAEVTIVIVVVSVAAFVFTGMFLEAIRSYQFEDAEKGMPSFAIAASMWWAAERPALFAIRHWSSIAQDIPTGLAWWRVR